MGLDAVEILMEVEEAFDISTEDAEVEAMTTPRDLIDTVYRKVAHAEASACLTQRSFNLVRKSLMSRLGLTRREIAPAIPLEQVVPKARRADLLQELAADLHTGPLPELQRPPRLLQWLALVSLSLGVLAAFALHRSVSSAHGFLTFCLGLAVATGAQTCAWFLTTPLCAEFPPVVGTVGQLARWVTAHKPDLAMPASGRWTREQVAARVREIIIDQLGCEKTYREDASFVQDLGLS